MARVVWRALDEPRGFPEWFRALRRGCTSGAYAIRDKRTKRVLYVGESHSCGLYGTISRHFQRWTRTERGREAVRFQPSGARGEHDPGLTYNRRTVEVAVWLVPQARAREKQDALIVELRPRDNLVGAVVDDDVPF